MAAPPIVSGGFPPDAPLRAGAGTGAAVGVSVPVFLDPQSGAGGSESPIRNVLTAVSVSVCINKSFRAPFRIYYIIQSSSDN